MNDRHPFLASQQDVVNFISGLYPEREKLIGRIRQLREINAQYQIMLRITRSDRELEFRRSIKQLGYVKPISLLVFSFVTARLLNQNWSSQSITLEGYLLLLLSIGFLIFVDRREASLGRWVFNSKLYAEFWPTEAAVSRVYGNPKAVQRFINMKLRGRVLR